MTSLRKVCLGVAVVFFVKLFAVFAYGDDLPPVPPPDVPSGGPLPSTPIGATWFPSNPKVAEAFRTQSEKDRDSLENKRAAQPGKNLDGYFQGIGKYKQNIQIYHNANTTFQKQ